MDQEFSENKDYPINGNYEKLSNQLFIIDTNFSKCNVKILHSLVQIGKTRETLQYTPLISGMFRINRGWHLVYLI